MKFLSPVLSLSVILTLFLLSPAYALAATLSLSPSSGTFNKGCPFSLDINLDTQNAETDGTDAILLYDNTRLTANSIDTELPQKIYNDFPGSNIDEAAGRITVSGLASVSSAFNGRGTMAKIYFTVKDSAATGLTQVKFDFTSGGKTTDSNVVERGSVQDILTSVTNGNYTVGTGACGAAAGTPSVPSTSGNNNTVFVSTPSGQAPATIDQFVDRDGNGPGGTPQLTFTLAIVGSVLTVLGILGLALL